MIELFKELKGTSAPAILVAGGFIFLLLALAGGVYGRFIIEIPPHRQKWAALSGSLLLILGIAIFMVPTPVAPSAPTAVAAIVPSDTPPPRILPANTPASPTDISAPSATLATPPAETATHTLPPVLPTRSCGESAIVSDIFPQLADKVPFFGPFEDHFSCEGVTDVAKSDPGALRIVYLDTGDREKFGYFGIGPLDGFDASQFSELCLSAYATEPNQAFWLKAKDMHEIEGQEEVRVDVTGQWLSRCVDLEKYASQGVDLSQLENITLGFDSLLGSAEIWFDDFELKQTGANE